MSELAKADAVEFRRSLLRDVARQPDNTADGDQLRGWACRIRTSESVLEPPNWICVTISPEGGASPAAETLRVPAAWTFIWETLETGLAGWSAGTRTCQLLLAWGLCVARTPSVLVTCSYLALQYAGFCLKNFFGTTP